MNWIAAGNFSMSFSVRSVLSDVSSLSGKSVVICDLNSVTGM